MQRLLFPTIFALLTLLLVACTGTPFSQPTPQPIIIIATPQTAPSPDQPQPTATAAVAATPDTDTTPEPATPTVMAVPATDLEPVIFAFDTFPSYLPGILIETEELLTRRGYALQLVPFEFNGENEFSEDERFARLQSGEWDFLATTLDGFARRSDPSIGAITALIDESAGADKLVAAPGIATLNDLRGQRIAFSEGSVGEFFLYYALDLAGLGPDDVTLVSFDTVTEAVDAYLAGEVDAVSAWKPDVLAAEEQGAAILIASDELRAILDVLVSSRVALDNRPEAVQAFHEAWFEALKFMTDNPAQAEQALIDWGYNDWTGIAETGDLNASLETLAQANLGTNQLAFRSPDLLISRLREAQTVWREAGIEVPEADLAQMIDGRFVAAAAAQPELTASRPPVNSSFLLTAQVDLPQLTAQQQADAQAVVQLPLEQIDFEPDSQRLTAQAIDDLSEQVLPVLRSSRLYLKIEGSSAWPGPAGRFSEEEILAFAESRANSVAIFLVQQGINPNRLLIGTLPPQFPNGMNEAELSQDRIVRFTLVSLQGR